MKHFNILLILLILVVSCEDNAYKKATIYDYIPEEASITIIVNNTESLANNLNNNAFISSISKSSAYEAFLKKLNHLDYISTEHPITLSFLKDKQDSLQFIITTKQVANLFQVDSLQNIKTENIAIASNNAKKIAFKNDVLFATFKDSIAIGASNKALLKRIIAKRNTNEARQKIINTIDSNKPFSVVLSNTEDNLVKTIFNSEVLPFKNFSDYMSIDALISQDEIIYNGITKASDSSQKLLSVFKNTLPQENQLAQIAPNNCDGFLSITFNDFSTFKSNLDQFNKKQDSTFNSNLFDNITEVGTIYNPKDQAIILNSLDVISTKESLLNQQNKVDTFRGVSIFDFSQSSLFKSAFYPLINYDSINYYCVVEQFFIFAKSKETLENIIANYKNETTLSSRYSYTNITKELSSDASILYVLNNDKLKALLEKNLETTLKSDFKDFKISALQFVYDTHYAHINGAIKKNKIKVKDNAVTEQLNIKLENDILNNPQFVTNHRTREKEIVVQDVKNNLYLISNTGNILWKKQLNGPILGNVNQIDVYKNGKLQLAFATPNRVYLIDRTGKNVSDYPLKFNDEITQPLSVFDYDNNKNYRLFVTQDKNVLLYNAKGKTVKGFNFSSAEKTINHQPQHIRIGFKDYVIIKTEDKLNILDRRGKTRINIKKNLKYSNQPVFQYNKTFTTTTVNGKVISINENGTIETKPYNLTEEHHLFTTIKTFAAQSESDLYIKGNKIELDLGNYTPLKIFYIRDKLYITLTDLQSQKVFIFDSRGKSVKNFPVYGNSTLDLNNIDRDKNLEFITKGDSNSILLYEIN